MRSEWLVLRHRAWILGVVITAVSVVGAVGQEQLAAVAPHRTHEHQSQDCGPRALAQCCEILAIPSDASEFARLTGLDPSVGTNLYQLMLGANRKGLKALALEAGPDQLCEIESPIVAHSRTLRHFVVLKRVSSDKFILFPLDGSSREVAKEQLSNLVDGRVLVVSRGEGLWKGPRVIFEEYTHDFGHVLPGQKVEFAFRFRNAGTEALVITEVKATCKCSVVQSSGSRIEPGEEGSIVFGFRVGQKSGHYVQSVAFLSNDPVEPAVKLSGAASVENAVEVLPDAVDFGKVRTGSGAIRKLKVLPNSPTSAAPLVTSVECDRRYFFAESLTTPGADAGNTGEVLVALRPDAPCGRFRKAIRIHMSDATVPIVAVEASGEVTRTLEVRPVNLFFGEVAAGKECQASVRILPSPSAPVRVLAVESPTEHVSGTCRAEDDETTLIVATIHANAPKGLIRSALRVRTDSPEEPVLEVPVEAWVK